MQLWILGSIVVALTIATVSGVSSGSASQGVPSDAGVQPAVLNREPLQRNAFSLLPLGAVKPRGWLRDQLRIQADGLGGHLDEFWPDLGPDSGWLGGTGESWERGPYFLDGLVPLAYLLEDQKLIAKAKRWVEWTLTHQRPDGAIGPPKNTDWWPNMVMVKVLTQYQEATGDSRVQPLLTRYFAHHLAEMNARPLKEWAIYRWQDQALASCGSTTGRAIQSSSSSLVDCSSRGSTGRASSRTSRTAARSRRTGPAQHARRQQRHGAQGAGGALAVLGRQGRSRRRLPAVRNDGQVPPPAGRRPQRRRALCRTSSIAGHRALRRGRGDVLD